MRHYIFEDVNDNRGMIATANFNTIPTNGDVIVGDRVITPPSEQNTNTRRPSSNFNTIPTTGGNGGGTGARTPSAGFNDIPTNGGGEAGEPRPSTGFDIPNGGEAGEPRPSSGFNDIPDSGGGITTEIPPPTNGDNGGNGGNGSNGGNSGNSGSSEYDNYENPYNFDHCYDNTGDMYSLAVNYEKPENYNLISSMEDSWETFK